MSKKRKSSKQDARLTIIVLLTAILNLVEALMEIIKKLLE